MRAILANGLGCLCVLTGLIGPILLGVRQQQSLRHFAVVRPGVLYRSAQLTPLGLQRLLDEYGIRTIVTLREGNSQADQEEQAFCERRGLKFVRIPLLSWDGVQGSAPVEQGLHTFLDLLRDSTNHPILIHCYRGVHRTGAYVAIYRMEYEGWTVQQAMREMVAHGYTILHKHQDVCRYLQSYRPTGRYQVHVSR